jgi:signal transduction histidine kinase
VADQNSRGPDAAPLACNKDGSGVFVRGRVQWHDAVVYAIHDARNHVMSILASVDFLQHATSQPLSDPEAMGELDCIKSASKQLALLLSEALASGRQDAHEVVGSNQDLMQIVDESAARLRQFAAARRGVRIEVQQGPRSTMVADASVLRRVVDNLLFNAIQHAPAGGVVLLSWILEGDRIVVSVRDPGWTSREAEAPIGTVSEPPRSSQAPPSERDALGFAFCRAVARAYGGEIRFGEPEPEGTVVSFCLPVPTETEPASECMNASL